MASTRTLARMVRKLEESTGRSAADRAWSARLDAVRAATNRIMACREAHMLAITASEWMMQNAPRGANPFDYPEMVEMMNEVARLVAEAETKAARAA